jgi:hypothetical protein
LPETHTKIEFVNEIAPQIERWDNLEQLNKKRLLRLALEAIFIHRNALAGITPTSTFLPLVWQVPCLCGEGGSSTEKDPHDDTKLITFTPETSVEDAVLVIQYRHKPTLD